MRVTARVSSLNNWLRERTLTGSKALKLELGFQGAVPHTPSDIQAPPLDGCPGRSVGAATQRRANSKRAKASERVHGSVGGRNPEG
jgi:hypothetical protein